MVGLKFPISSRNTVPPLASSRSPFFARSAPVNAPRTCPKSSDSMMVSVRVLQSMGTKGLACRSLSSWTARARSSLPVPLSPRMSTVALARETRFTRVMSFFITGLSPTMDTPPLRTAPCSLMRASSFLSAACSRFFSTLSLNSRGWKGLDMKSLAPFFMAFTASSTPPWPVMMMTGISASCVLIFARSSKPSSTGRKRSEMTRSNSWRMKTASASPPSAHATVVWPLLVKMSAI